MIRSEPGIASVHVLHGAEADPGAPPALLVEVPHGADTQADYDAVARQLKSPLPDRLERFFHVNTDVGAFPLGLRTAERFVEAVPTASALVVRAEIPRTFVDVNRVIGEAARDGLNAALLPWVVHPDDRAWLTGLHARYTALVEAAYQRVCDAGGIALIPHSYAPREVPIAAIDFDIVAALEHVYAPERIETAPLRGEVDLITRTPEGADLAPPGMAERLTASLAAHGITVHHNGAYNLHPVTMGARWSNRWPGQVLCFEVRRDLVTHWDPFVPKALRTDGIDRLAASLVDALC